MTWDEILAMDEEALNLAIEALEGRVWTKTTLPGVGHPTYASVHHLHSTASWEQCMALAWREHICITHYQREEWLILTCDPPLKTLRVTTEHEARIAICRLALWRQHQEVPHGE